MIIGKKTLVSPVELGSLKDDGIPAEFHDRSLLHDNKVPSFSVYILHQAWNAFIQRAIEEYSNHGNEASGIILGYYLKDEFGEYVVGTHFEAGTGDGTTSVFCEISVQDQLRIIQVADQKKLLQLIWIHSHPSFGAFYSTFDYRTLKSMYYAPHQAGIVVDNIKKEYMGFKVRNHSAYEFKEILLVSTKDHSHLISKPFGKDPVKAFYPKAGIINAGNRNMKEPVSLKPYSNNMSQNKGPDLVEKLEKIVDDLRLLIPGKKEIDKNTEQIRQDWEMKLDELEIFLNERCGELPYKNVAPYFKSLNDLRSLLKDGLSVNEENEMKEKLDRLQNLMK